jgi:hypothetical protein
MSAWSELLADNNWCRGAGHFPVPAYSEMLPPPWLGPKPYDGQPGNPPPLRADDCGWNVSEYEEEVQLWPGIEHVSRIVLGEMMRLGHGQPLHYLARHKFRNNPAWPAELAGCVGRLHHERYVLLLPVSLSRTQDDKGRLRWTLFGASEQGPGKAFWRGFFTAPGVEAPWSEAEGFFVELLSRCYGVKERLARKPGGVGVRVLRSEPDEMFPYWDEGPLPSWAEDLRYTGLKGTKYLLTFRPFETLPSEVRQAYQEGRLHLWPFPGSLLFWYIPGVRQMQHQFPFALQVALLYLFARRNVGDGLRIPQAGWMHEKVPAATDDAPEAARGTVPRTHRWQKVRRFEDEVNAESRFAPITRALFSSHPDDLELYNKPLARQAQVWTDRFHLVLDGTRHSRARIERAARLISEGGKFGYRFVYPAMRVGHWEVYWQLPMAAFAGEYHAHDNPAPVVLLQAPSGYLTAYRAEHPDLARPIELWPRFTDRPAYQAAVELFRHENPPRNTTDNVRSLLQWHVMLEGPLPRSLARALLTVPQRQTLDSWLDALPTKASDPVSGEALVEHLQAIVAAEDTSPAADSLTFEATATRSFEEEYWRTIATLAHGRFRTKSNADCIRDEPTRAVLPKRRRDLDLLADYLVRRHRATVKEAGIESAWVGEHIFTWRTDFEYPWMGGWLRNQKKRRQERNVVVRIPGQDSSQVVIMADHYDTAYMHDRYYLSEGGTGARLAAAGADDNYSATAALLLAAPLLLSLSRQGRLGCDVWLIHLTGEEFPSDCLGARHLAQALVERTFEVHQAGGGRQDLSEVKVRGLYVSDMIAHNNEHSRYVFQIAPGSGPAPARLALIAHQANLAWDALAHTLNRRSPRRGAAAPQRSDNPDVIPSLTRHAILHGEVRPDWTARSTLFNTDGQIFSDAGIPAVLFMEDYDIDRCGYHDTHDTMANIDLDYGAALAAIVIETVAQATQLGDQ